MIVYDSTFEAWGSDLDENVLALARENAERAGVADQIRFFRADARKIRKPEGRKGTILTNPPYGERLLTPEEAEQLYRDIGYAFRDLEPWQIYVLTMSESFERSYGRRADKVRKLYNGMIPCNLYQYYLPKAAREERQGRSST
jgi:putative N6-adenine-specific DNA methylase